MGVHCKNQAYLVKIKLWHGGLIERGPNLREEAKMRTYTPFLQINRGVLIISLLSMGPSKNYVTSILVIFDPSPFLCNES